MKRTLCIAVTVFLIAVTSFGQSAQKVDDILETTKTTFGQAAYVILTALHDDTDEMDFDTAFDRFKNENQNVIRDSITAKDIIPIKTYAFLLMRAFNIKGGM